MLGLLLFYQSQYYLQSTIPKIHHLQVLHHYDILILVFQEESQYQQNLIYVYHSFLSLVVLVTCSQMTFALLLESLPTGEYLRMIRQSESVSGYIVLLGPNTEGAPSELPESAVHVELYTGDVRGVVRGKERRDGRKSVR